MAERKSVLLSRRRAHGRYGERSLVAALSLFRLPVDGYCRTLYSRLLPSVRYQVPVVENSKKKGKKEDKE
eukprot:scaffold24484_cov49-Attheya_sp.AAC.2